MGDETTAKGTRGEFFSVDRKGWEAATKLGLNPAVAYLVLARFTDRTNVFTSASVNAIEKHTGISRGRAQKAVEVLVMNNLVRLVSPQDAMRPRYEFIAAAKPGRKPKTPRVQKEPEVIWLPNEIVTGAAKELPPLERLRQVNDVLLVRLFVDLYRAQVLREDHGIDRRVLFAPYERTLEGEAAEFSVWSFANRGWTLFPSSDIMSPHKTDGEKPWAKAWDRIRTLTALGLLEFVPHLYESDGPDAEALFPCGRGNSTSIEDQIGHAAHFAGKALLSKFLQKEVPPWVVPVRMHLRNVQLIGIARLHYRPKTSLTAAWWAELRTKAEQVLSDFKAIQQRAQS